MQDVQGPVGGGEVQQRGLDKQPGKYPARLEQYPGKEEHRPGGIGDGREVVDPGRRQQQHKHGKDEGAVGGVGHGSGPGADSGFILARRAGWRRTGRSAYRRGERVS